MGKEELSVEEEEGFQDQDQEHHDKDRADDPFQEENGRGGESDGKVVRFEVTNEGEHEDAINLEDLGSPVQSRLIIQLPESSPTPKIEILDDPQTTVSKGGDLSNVVQHGEKERK